jgi:hypothetical protein
MKLIAEYTEQDIEFVTEASADGRKQYAIEGVFGTAEEPNRNNRVYSKPVMEKAVNKYVKEQVKTGRAVGELNHPDGPTINLDKVSHRITDLRMEGNNVMGKAFILDTPNGQIVKGLLDGGVRLGVSTRGMGSLEKRNGINYVKEDFMLSTVDIVQDPSASKAFVNGIMEGVEWIWNNGILEQRQLKQIETEIKNAGRTYRADAEIRAFKNFLSLLKQK